MTTPQSECFQKMLSELWLKHQDGVRTLRLILKNGVIEVIGQVRSFYVKQLLAEDLRIRTKLAISTRQLVVEKKN